MLNSVLGLIRVVVNKIHFTIMKLYGIKIKCKGKCTSRLNNEWAIDKNASLNLGYHFSSLQGCRFLIRKGGSVSIGDNVGINSNCIIACHKKIVICDGVEIGPNVCIYDHDHDFRCENGIKSGKYTCDDVYIGKNAWIGANAVILRGTKIGKNCIVAAGSIVKGVIPDNSTYIQKREKIIKENEIRRRNYGTT